MFGESFGMGFAVLAENNNHPPPVSFLGGFFGVWLENEPLSNDQPPVGAHLFGRSLCLISPLPHPVGGQGYQSLDIDKKINAVKGMMKTKKKLLKAPRLRLIGL